MTIMHTGHKVAHIPLPVRMEHLPKDQRGYPIPYNVWRDKQGTPHFTINDHEKVWKIISERRCPICGNELAETMWFVGGPLSALSEHGAYIDQPMHEECAKYALQVCPYLAAPVYSKRIDARKVDPANMPSALMFQDNTMIPDRPVFFVAVEASGYDVSPKGPALFYLRPHRPYVSVEFWLQGERIPKKQAAQLMRLKAGTEPD